MKSPLIAPPEPSALPAGRVFSEEFLRLWELALEWIHDYRDWRHLARTGDWLFALDPDADEPLIIAALTHDMERTVPGGPVLDMARTPWDDPEYNAAHCARSAEVVARWLVDRGASNRFVDGVHRPILEHEFGGSPEGDLVQAADSISFLETNAALVARWVERRECSLEKGRDKVRWMCDRVRIEGARGIAQAQCELAIAEVDRWLAAARQGV